MGAPVGVLDARHEDAGVGELLREPGHERDRPQTPGIHRPLHRMNVRMVDAAVEAMREVDVVSLVVDVAGEGADDLPRDKRHLIAKALRATFDAEIQPNSAADHAPIV